MFSSIGWGEILVIFIVAILILGPERLPEATRYVANGLRKLRDWTNNAKEQIKEDVGEDFGDLKELQKPVKELARIKAMGPKAAAVHYLLDDDESLLDVDLGVKDLKMDLKELSGLNMLDESPFADSAPTPAQPTLQPAAPSAPPSTLRATPEQAAFNSDSLANYRPQEVSAASQPAAPSTPLTVGDSWNETSADDIEIIVDNKD